MIPIRLYAIKREAGPPIDRDLPEETNRPAPTIISGTDHGMIEQSSDLLSPQWQSSEGAVT